MAIDLKKALGGNSSGWPLGETRKLPIDPTKTIVEHEGMTLALRNAIRVIVATDYPEFYAMTDGFYSASFFTTRNPSLSGFTAINSVDSNGSVIVIVGNGGKIGRSTDSGVTWSLVSVGGVTADLKLVHYNPGLARWFIYYNTNKVLISTDNGVTFTDTTVTGLAFAANLTGQTSYLRAQTIGNTTVVSCNAVTFVTTNGTTYTTPTMAGAEIAAGKLTKGNGWFCILTSTYRLYVSATGTGAWTNVIQFTKDANVNPFVSSYGVVYTGTRWVLGLGGPYMSELESNFPKTGVTPGPTDYYRASVTSNVLAYTTGGTMGDPSGSWSYITRTIGGYYETSWTTNGGSIYWLGQRIDPAVFNGPSETFGSYGFNGTWAFGTTYRLYARDLWESVIANSSNFDSYFNIGNSVTGANITAVDALQVTNNFLIANDINGSATFKLSESGSTPSRSLPINSSGSGEGTSVTRIK